MGVSGSPTTISSRSSRWSWPLVELLLVSLGAVFVLWRRGQELPAFLASALFLAAMLAATAAGGYPVILASTLDPAYHLTVHNAAAGGLGLRIGLVWWSLAILLAIGYFGYVFYAFRGKVTPGGDERGY